MPCADYTMRPIRMRAVRRLTLSEYRMGHLTAVKLVGKVNEAGEVMRETVYAKLFGSTKDEAKYAAGLEKVRRDLGVLEKALAGKEFLCGKLTLADFSLVSSLLLRTPMGVDLEAFPHVKAWVARMESRESVRKSLPPM